MNHAAVPSSSTTLVFCTCNQGFSGHQAVERLAGHIANPRTDDLGSLLGQLMGQSPA